MGAAWLAFAAFTVVSFYAACWLVHRFSEQADRCLHKWWGLPTALIFGPILLLGIGLLASQITYSVLS